MLLIETTEPGSEPPLSFHGWLKSKLCLLGLVLSSRFPFGPASNNSYIRSLYGFLMGSILKVHVSLLLNQKQYSCDFLVRPIVPRENTFGGVAGLYQI